LLLERRDAVVYGGAGSIGSAAHLAGRTLASLEAVAGEIRAAGDRPETAVVDALDEAAVDAHADGVAERAGRWTSRST
jgi:3-oxoacyl-[acyl-carrier protein] reductase